MQLFFCCILVLPLSLQLSTSLKVTKTHGLVLVLAVVGLVNIQCLWSHPLFPTIKYQTQSSLNLKITIIQVQVQLNLSLS